MIAAFAIGYFGGITNWPMWFGIHFPPYPNILISVYTLIVAYAMVKHHLMDINIVIRKTLLYSILSVGLASLYAGVITFLAYLLGGQDRSSLSLPYQIATSGMMWKWIDTRIRMSFGGVWLA